MRGVVIERTLEDEFLEVLQEHVGGADPYVLPAVSVLQELFSLDVFELTLSRIARMHDVCVCVCVCVF